MADAATAVPGTWFVTVTFPPPDGRITRVVMTFTSDGVMVERAEPRVETGVGVWEAGDEESQFRSMFFRFLEDLTVTPAPGNPGRVLPSFRFISRVRSTHRLIDDNTFTGTSTIDALDAAGSLLSTPAAYTGGLPYHPERGPNAACPGVAGWAGSRDGVN